MAAKSADVCGGTSQVNEICHAEHNTGQLCIEGGTGTGVDTFERSVQALNISSHNMPTKDLAQ